MKLQDYSGVIYTGKNPDNSVAFYVYCASHNSLFNTGLSDAKDFETWVDLNCSDTSIPIIVIAHVPLHAQRNDNPGAVAWNKALNYAATGEETTSSGKQIIRNVVFLHGHNHTTESNREYYIPAGSTMNIYNSSNLSYIYYTYTTAGYLNANNAATLIAVDDGNLTITKYKNSSVPTTNAYSNSVSFASNYDTSATHEIPEYYVIRIGNYALSSTDLGTSDYWSSSSSSSNKYYGLKAEPYDANEDPDDKILWKITPDEDNIGYYIQSKTDTTKYLNATYETVNNTTTGHLYLSETKDVWSLDSGITLDTWKTSGSNLTSGNASTTSKPIYLAQHTGLSGTELFTIRSSNSNNRTTYLAEPSTGGTTPVDPPSGNTVEVTPDTSNPEKTVTISVGESITLKVTNSSTRSAYDFAATLSESGVASITPSSVNIAAGGTGTYTITGVEDGTVDITISNNNNSSERKATIHVTVGNGGSSGATETRYVETTEFVNNKEYIVAVDNGSGGVYVLKNAGSGSLGSENLTVYPADSSSAAYIKTTDTSLPWTYTTATRNRISNSSRYLTINSTSKALETDTSGNYAITYNANQKIELTYPNSTSGNIYYVKHNGTNFVATSANDSADATTIRLFVKTEVETEPVELEGITLNKSSLNMETGNTETLTVTYTPADATNKTVSWSTSNSSVATVTNGVVTAVSAGTAVVTATSAVDSGITASCTVTVTAAQTVDYILTDTLEAGQEYLIANGNSGSVFLVSNDTTGTGSSAGLVGVSANVVNGKISITNAVAAKTVFESELEVATNENSIWLKSGGKYLYCSNNNGITMESSGTSPRYWHYIADDNGTAKNLLWFFNGSDNNYGYTDTSSTNKYYLSCSSSGTYTRSYVTTSSLANTNTPPIYLFIKAPEGDYYTLSYNANGGTGTIAAQTLKATYTTKANSFIREGYEFSKWNTKADGTGTDYEPGASITLTEDTTLYAQWTKQTSITKTVYVKTDTLSANEKYLIVNTGDTGDGIALGRSGTSVVNDNVVIKAGIAETNNSVFIESDLVDSTSVWTTSSGIKFMNGTYYLRRSSSTLQISTTNSSNSWTWDGTSNRLTMSGSSSTYYLRYSSSNSAFAVGTTQGSVYLYQEKTITISLEPGITVEPETATVGVGNTKTLTATSNNVEGTPTVTWSSDHPEFATIDQNGVVTGVAVGTATITASMTYEGVTYTDTCEVTVKQVNTLTYNYIAEAVTGTAYVIVSNGYALVNNNGAVAAVPATISGNTITLLDDEYAEANMLWTLGEDGSLSNNGVYVRRASGSDETALTLNSSTSTSYTNWVYNGEQITVYSTNASTDYYMFYSSGWKTSRTANGTTKLYGEAAAASYTVTWMNGNTVIETDENVAPGATPSYDGETPTKEGDAQYSYTFAGWSTDGETVLETLPLVSEDVTYKAVFEQTVNKYTVTFVDEDGTVLKAATEYDYGTVAAEIAKPSDPTKPATVQYTYMFAGWSPVLTTVTEDATYTATYSSTVNKYTVTFVDEDGTVLKEATEYDYGTAAADIVKPADPTKAATPQYTYTFAGWSPELASVTENASYTATYSSTVNKYTVTFYDEDGTTILLATAEYEYGTAWNDVVKPADPSKTGYTFTGWTGVPETVTDNIEIKASYIVNQYTLIFKDGDTVVTVNKDYGAPITLADIPADPTKAFYTFTGWGNTIPETMPAENLIFNAQWTAKDTYYVVGSMNEWTVSEAYELTASSTTTGEYSGSVALTAGDQIKVVRAVGGVKVDSDHYPSTEHPGYNGTTANFMVDTNHAGNVTLYFRPDGNFNDEGWQGFGGYFYIEGDHNISVIVATGVSTGTARAVRGDVQGAATTAPKDKPITVECTPADGYQLTKIELWKNNGEAAEQTLEGYTFTMPDYDVTIKVYYEIKTYTITWKNDDGTVIDTTTVEHGSVPTHAAATKAETAGYTYTFTGWTPEPVAATEDTAYTAVFTETAKEYTITFVTGDGASTVAPMTVAYGAQVTAPAVPTREGYTFKGWSPALPATMPAENLTVTAQWEIKTYTITWKNDDGTVIDTTTVEHGSVPTHAAATKAETAGYTYTFTGWTPEPVAATANAEYTAVFTETAKEYTITFVTGDGASTVAPMTVAYGAQVTAPAAPTREGYTFTGWDPALPVTMPAEDLTVTAQWAIKTYTITWKNWNGEVLETDNDVAYGATPTYDGATPTKNPDGGDTYTFAGWSPTVTTVTGNATYTAQFNTHSTYTVSVTVKTFGEATDEVTVSLVGVGTGFNKSNTGLGNETTIAISSVPAGNYTLTIHKDKHVDREYAVSVSDTGTIEITEDGVVANEIKLHLKGDVTGDGKITTIDFARAYRHARHVEATSPDAHTKYVLTGYAFKCADINGNGEVTTAEAGMINSYARGIITSFDETERIEFYE